ncbi:GGDEF domain-containing protein [Mesorhizobium sp. WSM2239]|uniref:diguanylate cyclase n=2 Tax=unclassified Mesorhizobium TaxID=325217 RepID=A0AAU8DH02_9HYPH
MDEVLRTLFEMYERTPVLVAAYDGFDRLRYANQAFRSAYFLGPQETPFWSDLMRRNFHARRGTVIRTADFETWLISTQSRRGKTAFRAFETDLVDGRWLWMTETVQSDGWMLCIASDITELRTDERTVRQDRDFAIKASHTDELTNVANRRFVMARIDDMLQRPAKEGELGCLGVLDIDRFKSINDRYGHQTGDLVLRDFARRILDLVRRSDCFGRVGGEEFVLVLPDTSIEEAALILERMLAVIRSSKPLPDRPDFSYTFSAGIAAGGPADIAANLYARADKALYSAKMAGRNRVELADSAPRQSAVAGRSG